MKRNEKSAGRGIHPALFPFRPSRIFAKASLIWSAFGKSEEIDDGTLSPEVPSSISPRPPGRLEWNAEGRGWNEALKAGNSCESCVK